MLLRFYVKACKTETFIRKKDLSKPSTLKHEYIFI